jgi:hypothetical protein
MSNSEIQRKLAEVESRQGSIGGKCRLRYGGDCDFEVWMVHRDDAFRSHRMSFPTHRLPDLGGALPVPWTVEQLIDAMQFTLRQYNAGHPGLWSLEIRRVKETIPF